MLQIRKISKKYVTGDLTQIALDNVSLSLRDNEFVAILGPSGSGKTTLLNIIGGLDRYDSGDLIINNISTKKYSDRDWDSYRNHTIGFVFQSYNLIPHQTVLSNVELALTISGISASERKARAKEALEKVGLGDQLHKKPNQMSGGQMQRVAIARALVNDPDILLADEPTGALDTKTSVQIMELLKEVAKDRLVVMVTHNPELAEAYATRIVQLKDGHIIGDTDPFAASEKIEAVHKNMGHSAMSFLTALTLSFNNLKTKKGRTILTAFAGSIGIIGIALILSLSNGVNTYINGIEEDTLSEYPLGITKSGMDISAMLADRPAFLENKEGETAEVIENQTLDSVLTKTTTNDLASLKEYIESGKSDIYDYSRAIEYSYDVTPQIYRLLEEDDYRQVNPDHTFSSMSNGGTDYLMMAMSMSSSYFNAMPENEALYIEQYDVMAGRWPENYLECVLVLSSESTVSDIALYGMGLKDADQLDEYLEIYKEKGEVKIEEEASAYKYEDFLDVEFKLVDASACYGYDAEYDIYVDKTDNHDYMLEQVKNGETMKIVGVVKPNEDTNAAMLTTGIVYPAELEHHVMELAEESAIVKKQKENPDINVFTGNEFGDEDTSLDMESMFSIDEDALANAFAIDSSAFDFDMSSLSGDFDMDLSSLDLSSIDMPSIDMSGLDMSGVDMSNMDLGSLLQNISIEVSIDELENLFTAVLNGYLEEMVKNPSTDYTQLSSFVRNYLQSDTAAAILREQLQAILSKAESALPDSEELNAMVQDIMSGYMEYLVEQGVTDFSEADNSYLAAYLATEAVQTKIQGYIDTFKEKLSNGMISQDDIAALANALYQGYETYASENGGPQISAMMGSFTDYMQSAEGQALVYDALNKVINLDEIKNQLSAAMASMMSGYAEAIQNSIQEAMTSMMSAVMSSISTQIGSMISSEMASAMGEISDSMQKSMQDAFAIDADAFSDAIKIGMDSDALKELMSSMMSSGASTYSEVLASLNYAEKEDPDTILIYPKDFESKNEIVAILDDYNVQMEKNGESEKIITYSDMVATMMSSITTIIDAISYVLVAFVAISLVVSSIMIGIITYISVLERTKEIGILRAIGASKRNISQVFNAETFIIGLLAGAIGVGTSLLLLIPINAIIHSLTGSVNISASLPVTSAVILVVLSTILTLIGGFIPAKSAAKKDPVTALRTD